MPTNCKPLLQLFILLSVGLTVNSAYASSPTFFLERGDVGERSFQPPAADDRLPWSLQTPLPEMAAGVGSGLIAFGIPGFVVADLLLDGSPSVGFPFAEFGAFGARIVGGTLLIAGGIVLAIAIACLADRAARLRKLDATVAQRTSSRRRDSRMAQARVTWGLHFGPSLRR
jgi:hypothetical protein